MQLDLAHDMRKDYQNAMICYNYVCITHIRNESFLVTALLNKALDLHKTGRLKKALHIQGKAEHLLHTLNKTRTLIDADIILGKAQIFDHMGDINDSFSNFEVALGIYKEAVGKSHPNVAKFMQYLVTILLKEGTHYYVERDLEIRQKELGINHEETENSLYDKGLVFFAQKEYIQCIACMSYATFMFTKKEGKQLDIANTNFISGCCEDELKNTIRSYRF